MLIGKNNVMERFKLSAVSFKSLPVIVFCGMMGALSVILGQFSVKVTDYLTVTVAWIPNRVVDAIFGPVVGMVFGGVMDIVKFIIKPSGAFNFFYTLVPMVAGLITGYFLYRKKVTFVRVLISEFVMKLVCNVIMTTWANCFFYGSVLQKILPVRALKNLVEWPVHSLILYLILMAFSQRILPMMREKGWPV